MDSGWSMHMISKKDLNSAELETVTISRSPMTVITANCEVQSHEEATVYECPSFAMNMDTHMSGSTVKNHISLNMVFQYSATRKTANQSWFLVYQRVLPQACLLQHR